MATVRVDEVRHQLAHYGLYRTALGGDEKVIVRRKVGEKTDCEHKKSRKVRNQRTRLGIASKHWSSLTPTQKSFYRRQVAFVQRTGSPSEEVLLKGRELFISWEINNLISKGQRLLIPQEICIVLCDTEHHPLNGYLWLWYYEDEEWKACQSMQLNPGNWLFPTVPRGKEFYRVEGYVPGYYDPKLAEHQWMSESYLQGYKYHELIFGLELVILEHWSELVNVPELEKVIEEPWNKQTDPQEFEQVIYEPWTS